MLAEAPAVPPAATTDAPPYAPGRTLAVRFCAEEWLELELTEGIVTPRLAPRLLWGRPLVPPPPPAELRERDEEEEEELTLLPEERKPPYRSLLL